MFWLCESCGDPWMTLDTAVSQAPWGGRKASGYGRELGTYGFDAYLSVKQVTTYVSKQRWDWYPVESKL